MHSHDLTDLPHDECEAARARARVRHRPQRCPPLQRWRLRLRQLLARLREDARPVQQLAPLPRRAECRVQVRRHEGARARVRLSVDRLGLERGDGLLL